MLALKIIISSVFILLSCDIEDVQAKVRDISEKKCKEWSQLHVATKRIRYGTEAKEGEFPHMVAVAYESFGGTIQFKCAGSLISERYVLSAAHCVAQKTPKFVRLGTTNVETPGQLYKDFNISNFIIHEKYNFTYNQYNLSIADIALFRLHTDVKFSKTIMPICLQASYKFDTDNIIATGWGCTELKDYSSSLSKVTLPVKDDDDCRLLYDAGIPKSTVLCLGGDIVAHDYRDTCGGDSGGPLQIYKGTQLYAVAVVLGGTNFYTTYATRVSVYLDWIEDHVWGVQ